MVNLDFSFVLLLISTLLVVALFGLILKIKPKSQIHYIFLLMVTAIFIWNVGHILEVITSIRDGYTNMLYINIYYFGVCFVPLTILLTGLVFVRTKLKFTFRYIVLLIFPVIDYLILLTNKFHHLFFLEYSIFNNQVILGNYFIVHTIGSYLYIGIGLYYLISFTVKNSGFFSRQSVLIITGVIVPLSINFLISFNLIILPVFYTPISFSISIMCFALAIFKFQFLNISPIALQRIVDLISDSYLIINKNYQIIDYNQAFIDTFKNSLPMKRKDNLLEIFDSTSLDNKHKNQIITNNEKSIKNKITEKYEDHFNDEFIDKYFSVEITPIYSSDIYLGTIILLKDITQSKRDLETIKKTHAIIMEQERLASLGQLIGGIAHNLKTPIMTISGGLEAIREFSTEYDVSIEDKSVTKKDHHAIAADLIEWVDKIKPYCSYMSDVISAVKDQTVNLSNSTTINFTLSELLKRVELLMKHELKKYHCQLNIQSEIGMLTEFKGGVNNLVQIFDNLIVNAIQSYGKKQGIIDLKIKQKDEQIVFSVKDYGMGISPEIQKKLFKEMLTTKGKDGTGLGLYMSYSTIKGRFSGEMWLHSTLGKGSTIYISIPYFNLVEKV
ncbi:MAG: hypothetical protein KAG94_00105 [Clostridiales bacterium]|nr:hypothetical protein [Clostridiales bacterium]